LTEPPIVVKKLFGTAEARRPCLEDVDTSFRFQRAGGKLSETIDLMQHVLVVAQERSERLNELEMKAESILVAAKRFHDSAKQLRK
jgi:hypothetical protein